MQGSGTVASMRRGPWTRVGASKGEVRARRILSAVAMLLGAIYIGALASSATRTWTMFIWPAIWIFLGWRFLVMGLYVSEWGVRISNPVLTYWRPWRDIEHFELGSTGEMFAPKAKGIVVVTKSGRRELAWALTTSRKLPSPLSAEWQEELIQWLNAQIPAAVSRAT